MPPLSQRVVSPAIAQPPDPSGAIRDPFAQLRDAILSVGQAGAAGVQSQTRAAQRTAQLSGAQRQVQLLGQRLELDKQQLEVQRLKTEAQRAEMLTDDARREHDRLRRLETGELSDLLEYGDNPQLIERIGKVRDPVNARAFAVSMAKKLAADDQQALLTRFHETRTATAGNVLADTQLSDIVNLMVRERGLADPVAAASYQQALLTSVRRLNERAMIEHLAIRDAELADATASTAFNELVGTLEDASIAGSLNTDTFKAALDQNFDAVSRANPKVNKSTFLDQYATTINRWLLEHPNPATALKIGRAIHSLDDGVWQRIRPSLTQLESEVDRAERTNFESTLTQFGQLARNLGEQRSASALAQLRGMEAEVARTLPQDDLRVQNLRAEITAQVEKVDRARTSGDLAYDIFLGKVQPPPNYQASLDDIDYVYERVASVGGELQGAYAVVDRYGVLPETVIDGLQARFSQSSGAKFEEGIAMLHSLAGANQHVIDNFLDSGALANEQVVKLAYEITRDTPPGTVEFQDRIAKITNPEVLSFLIEETAAQATPATMLQLQAQLFGSDDGAGLLPSFGDLSDNDKGRLTEAFTSEYLWALTQRRVDPAFDSIPRESPGFESIRGMARETAAKAIQRKFQSIRLADDSRVLVRSDQFGIGSMAQPINERILHFIHNLRTAAPDGQTLRPDFAVEMGGRWYIPMIREDLTAQSSSDLVAGFKWWDDNREVPRMQDADATQTAELKRRFSGIFPAREVDQYFEYRWDEGKPRNLALADADRARRGEKTVSVFALERTLEEFRKRHGWTPKPGEDPDQDVVFFEVLRQATEWTFMPAEDGGLGYDPLHFIPAPIGIGNVPEAFPPG